MFLEVHRAAEFSSDLHQYTCLDVSVHLKDLDQLLQEKLSDQAEKQQQALQPYRNQADQPDQWLQLCLRRQKVSEKLNEWAIFNNKCKQLCDWLTRMESKVSPNGDVSIEEMIDKLRKNYQAEVTAAQENKHDLQELENRLARASHESKASDIKPKLSKVNERWQHLLDLVGARARKLRETLVAVQQLDKNTSNLRSWLTHIETELSRPIIYDTCDYQEIQRKLDLQQELQRDIEKHSTGVASVLNLCEVLLRDCEACVTDAECDSIQQATQSLHRRWRSICAMSMERRLRIEETWRLWQKFLDDVSGFEEWLLMSERTAAQPNSSGVLYTAAKEELRKFEILERQVHEGLTQLEMINKQYQRLAHENRTDAACCLQEMMHNASHRWDNLQRHVASVLRRLKHFINQREEFETARDSILVWLTEMDLQLTNIEHFSECDIQAKIKQLKAFQQEITLNTAKMEHIFQQGEALLEKSEPIDAAVIEEELEELQRYCQEVFGHVERYYEKLTRLPFTDDEHEVSYSDQEFDLDETLDVFSFVWCGRLGDVLLSPLPSSSWPVSLDAPLQTEHSGRDSPASVDSIPLEWDYEYDLSRGLETARRTLSPKPGDQGQDGDLQTSASALSGDGGSLETHIRQLDKALNTSCVCLQQMENTIRSGTPTGCELVATYMRHDLSPWSSTDDLDTSGPVSGHSTPSPQQPPRGITACLSQPGACVSSPLYRSLGATRAGSCHFEEEESTSWCRTFLKRVLWTALPLQILLLLLLVLMTSLVPAAKEDYSCGQLNTFVRSFHPMLSYTNGPPPI